MAEATRTDEHPRESVKDTIESIVVALILAFVFRAFIVEAFVIPTGSMAPTLYGAHGTILCEDCGTQFAYGLRDLGDRRGGPIVSSKHRAYCPNCKFPNSSLEITDERGNPESGDRILVLKWPYDIDGSLLGPARWDVTVFKDPSDGTTNFIKRLVGLPNEVLMIVDGDVYTAPMSELSEETVAALDAVRREKYEFRIGKRVGALKPIPSFVRKELDAKAKIVRKTDVAKQSLWLPVYDHDMSPASETEAHPRWEPVADAESGWSTSKRRVHFEDRGLDGDTIVLRGPAIRATCAYNINGNAPRPWPSVGSGPPFVADQRVRFVLVPEGAGGSVAVALANRNRTFTATIGVDGRVSLVEKGPKPRARQRVDATVQIEPLTPGRPVQIAVEHADYRVAVSVGGEEVLVTSDDVNAPAYYAPDLAALRRTRSVSASRPKLHAEGGAFTLSHLAVDRDEYYYVPTSSALPSWAPRDGWGSAECPIMLRSHEYFMLGDNTAASKDSRLWDSLGPHLRQRGEACQLGAVPRDQLIGRAFFVYWPSMQRIPWLQWLPKFNRWGIVPDVGRMRWIR